MSSCWPTTRVVRKGQKRNFRPWPKLLASNTSTKLAVLTILGSWSCSNEHFLFYLISWISTLCFHSFGLSLFARIYSLNLLQNPHEEGKIATTSYLYNSLCIPTLLLNKVPAFFHFLTLWDFWITLFFILILYYLLELYVYIYMYYSDGHY